MEEEYPESHKRDEVPAFDKNDLIASPGLSERVEKKPCIRLTGVRARYSSRYYYSLP